MLNATTTTTTAVCLFLCTAAVTVTWTSSTCGLFSVPRPPRQLESTAVIFYMHATIETSDFVVSRRVVHTAVHIIPTHI